MKNWKTTAAGIGGAILTATIGYLSAHGITLHDYGLMLFQVILGLAAKDFNVSGKNA